MRYVVTDGEASREVEATSEMDAKRAFLAEQPPGVFFGRKVAGPLCVRVA